VSNVLNSQTSVTAESMFFSMPKLSLRYVSVYFIDVFILILVKTTDNRHKEIIYARFKVNYCTLCPRSSRHLLS